MSQLKLNSKILKKLLFIVSIYCFMYNVFAVEKPSIMMIENKGDYWHVYGTGLKWYDVLDGYFEDEIMWIKRFIWDKWVEYFDTKSVTNGEFHLHSKLYTWDQYRTRTIEEIDSDSLWIEKNINIYIKDIKTEIRNGKKVLILNLGNRNTDAKHNLKVFINNNQIAEQNVNDMGNRLEVYNMWLSGYNQQNMINILLKDNNKNISVKSFDLDNLLEKELEFSNIERIWKTILVYYKLNNIWNFSLFVDNEPTNREWYFVIWDTLIIFFDAEKKQSIYNFYVQTKTKMSRLYYVYIWNYLDSRIDKIVLSKWNRTLYDNYLYTKYIWINDKTIYGTWNNIILKINGKDYKLKTQNYSYCYKKIYNKYEWEIESLIWDEKQKKKTERDEELKKLDNMLFNFTIDRLWEKISFTQRKLYLTGSTNTIQLIVNWEATNILSFTAKDSREKQEYTNKHINTLVEDKEKKNYIYENKNLIWKFVPVKDFIGSGHDNKEFTIWELRFFSGQNLDYVFDINFNLTLELWEGYNHEYLPIEYVKLWDDVWFITKLSWTSNKYRIIFKNLLLKDLDSGIKEMKLKLTDNYNRFYAKIEGSYINYYIINKTNIEKYHSIIIENKGSLYINLIYTYVPCFDMKEDYSNCKILWYKTTSHYNWIFSNKEIYKKLNWSNTSLSKQYFLTKYDKNKMKNLMKKLNNYVEKKSGWNKQKTKLLYKKIIDFVNINLKKIKNSYRKQLLDYLLLLIREKI